MHVFYFQPEYEFPKDEYSRRYESEEATIIKVNKVCERL